MIENLIKFMKRKLKRDLENKEVNKEEMDSFFKNGAMLIDVRNPIEYQEAHLEGAISIPEYEIKESIQDKLTDKREIIIVYCSSGKRSKKAQKKLEKMGYENVYNLEGGFFS